MRFFSFANRSWPIVLLVWFIIIPGCKPSKNLVVEDIPSKSKSELRHALQSQIKTYKWITLKARLKYEDEWDSIKGTVHVQAKKDSIIWMKITKLGFEGARVRITPSFMEVINRIDKTYQKKSLHSIEDEFGISFSFQDIEDMILGNPLFPDLRYETSQDSTGYILQKNKDQIDVRYHLRPVDLLMDHMQLTQYRQGQITTSYEDYEHIDDSSWVFPKKRIYNSVEASGSQKTIEIKMTSTELNSPTSFSFNIPSHYEHIP